MTVGGMGFIPERLLMMMMMMTLLRHALRVNGLLLAFMINFAIDESVFLYSILLRCCHPGPTGAACATELPADLSTVTCRSRSSSALRRRWGMPLQLLPQLFA